MNSCSDTDRNIITLIYVRQSTNTVLSENYLSNTKVDFKYSSTNSPMMIFFICNNMNNHY